MRYQLRAAALAGGLVLLMGACSSGGGSDEESNSPSATATGEAAQGGTYSLANCEPEHLTPQNDYESCGTQVLEGIFTPLVSIDENGEVVMEQAESVESTDQKVWTIKIQPGWKFSNGEPVTAQSYVDAWNYAALGSNAFILNFFFERFEGYADLNPAKGKAKTTELSGLKALDDTTIQVTLAEPFSQFPIQLAFQAFFPLPKAFFDDPKAYDSAPIGDGPYVMDGEWQHNVTINLKRNPDFSGDTPGSADNIELPMYAAGQANAAYADIQAGNIDIDFSGSDTLERARKDFPDTLQEHGGATFLYLGVPIYRPEFKNPLLRQALSLAVDREAVMKAVLVAESPADAFVAPIVPGYETGACTNCVYDPDLAKQKFEQAGGFDGKIVLNFPGPDQTLAQALEAVGNQWKQNLGIDFEINPINGNSYFDVESQHKMTGPWWDGWVMDYPSMEDYLRPINGCTGGYNETTYCSQPFEDLVKEGDRASSIDDSISKYQEAQDLLNEDMPIIPWGFLGFNVINTENVTNVHPLGPFAEVALEDVQVVNQ